MSCVCLFVYMELAERSPSCRHRQDEIVMSKIHERKSVYWLSSIFFLGTSGSQSENL
jgi:hypothetical protein